MSIPGGERDPAKRAPAFVRAFLAEALPQFAAPEATWVPAAVRAAVAGGEARDGRRRGSEDGEEARSLVDLSGDLLDKMLRALTAPLTPRDAVALASICRGLWAQAGAVLAELRQRHEAAAALCIKAQTSGNTSCGQLLASTFLPWICKDLTVADCRALADVVATSGLPLLEKLWLDRSPFGAEGMQARLGLAQEARPAAFAAASA